MVKDILLTSEDSTPYTKKLVQFVTESSKPQIDQALSESDFKLSTLISLGSTPSENMIHASVSPFEKLDVLMSHVHQFGNDLKNFVVEEITPDVDVVEIKQDVDNGNVQ